MSLMTMTEFTGAVTVSAVSFNLEEPTTIVALAFRDEGGNTATIQVLQKHIPALYKQLTAALTPHLDAELLNTLEAELAAEEDKGQTTWSELPVPNSGAEAPKGETE